VNARGDATRHPPEGYNRWCLPSGGGWDAAVSPAVDHDAREDMHPLIDAGPGLIRTPDAPRPPTCKIGRAGPGQPHGSGPIEVRHFDMMKSRALPEAVVQ
jgi:hypothetical protein